MFERGLARFRVEQVRLVERLDDRSAALRIHAEFGEHVNDVTLLRFGFRVCDVADVDNDIRVEHFLERGAERRDEHRRQFGDETDRVGKDRLVDAGQRNRAHRGVERCEQ